MMLNVFSIINYYFYQKILIFLELSIQVICKKTLQWVLFTKTIFYYQTIKPHTFTVI